MVTLHHEPLTAMAWWVQPSFIVVARASSTVLPKVIAEFTVRQSSLLRQ